MVIGHLGVRNIHDFMIGVVVIIVVLTLTIAIVTIAAMPGT
jgi:hypothetical protein